MASLRIRSSERQIRLMVTSGHSLRLRGLLTVLSGFVDVTVVAQWGTPDGLYRAIEKAKPDILLLDNSWAENGYAVSEVVTHLREQCGQTALKFLVLLEEKNDSSYSAIPEILMSRVDAMCMDSIKPSALESAIVHIYNGGLWFDPSIADHIHHVLSSAFSSSDLFIQETMSEVLSPRECEILSMMTQGMNNRQIAQQLHLSVHTIKADASQVFRKLSVRDRVQAVAKVLRGAAIC